MTRIAHATTLVVLVVMTACTSPQSAVAPVQGVTPVLRPCPDWGRASREDFSNRNASNFGCADAVNFHAQLARPQDAVRGQGDSAGDAAGAATAIGRMRSRPAPAAPGGATPAAAAVKPGPGA